MASHIACTRISRPNPTNKRHFLLSRPAQPNIRPTTSSSFDLWPLGCCPHYSTQTIKEEEQCLWDPDELSCLSVEDIGAVRPSLFIYTRTGRDERCAREGDPEALLGRDSGATSAHTCTQPTPNYDFRQATRTRRRRPETFMSTDGTCILYSCAVSHHFRIGPCTQYTMNKISLSWDLTGGSRWCVS